MIFMEIWKDIKYWKGFYQVSDQGRVRSLTRKIKAKRPYGGVGFRTYRGKLLNTEKTFNYPHVKLVKNSKGVCRNVHELVLEAFKGPAPKGFEACHNDGSKTNNRLSNLRWDTRQNNSLDRRKHGTQVSVQGEQCAAAKLTDIKVRAIRGLARIGLPQRQIANTYGVSHSRIGAVLRGESWRHVK